MREHHIRNHRADDGGFSAAGNNVRQQILFAKFFKRIDAPLNRFNLHFLPLRLVPQRQVRFEIPRREVLQKISANARDALMPRNPPFLKIFLVLFERVVHSIYQ